MDASQLQVAVAILLVLLIGCILAMRLVVWSLYVTVRDERDLLQVRLDAVTTDRDGWRDVAQRALLVAQLGRTVTSHASRLALKVGE